MTSPNETLTNFKVPNIPNRNQIDENLRVVLNQDKINGSRIVSNKLLNNG